MNVNICKSITHSQKPAKLEKSDTKTYIPYFIIPNIGNSRKDKTVVTKQISDYLGLGVREGGINWKQA